MTRAGDLCVQLCESTRGLPKLILCITLVILQGTIFNVYLYLWLGHPWLCWFLYDAVNVALCSLAFVVSDRAKKEQERGNAPLRTIGWLAWLVLEVGVMVRSLIGFLTFCDRLDEQDFFGPTTFKTTIALSSAIFILLLTSHCEAPSDSPQRLYIVELTGTVFFDLIDIVEAVDVLFDKEATATLFPGLRVTILIVACVNLLLPTIPFVTLSLTGFGQRRLSSVLVSAHKALVTIAINLPNLIIRMIIWHGLSVGISVFVLKNIVLIVLNTYSFYEHKLEKYELHRRQKAEEEKRRKEHELHTMAERSRCQDQPRHIGNTTAEVADNPSHHGAGRHAFRMRKLFRRHTHPF